MNAIARAAEEIRSALSTIPNLKVYTENGSRLDPPGVFLAPPRLTWEAMCAEPTTATFSAFVVVASNERSTQALWSLVPQVTDALFDVRDAAVSEAVPGLFNNAGKELPCYEITIQMGLG